MWSQYPCWEVYEEGLRVFTGPSDKMLSSQVSHWGSEVAITLGKAVGCVGCKELEMAGTGLQNLLTMVSRE